MGSGLGTRGGEVGAPAARSRWKEKEGSRAGNGTERLRPPFLGGFDAGSLPVGLPARNAAPPGRGEASRHTQPHASRRWLFFLFLPFLSAPHNSAASPSLALESRKETILWVLLLFSARLPQAEAAGGCGWAVAQRGRAAAPRPKSCRIFSPML